jgi:hypothetical protein
VLLKRLEDPFGLLTFIDGPAIVLSLTVIGGDRAFWPSSSTRCSLATSQPVAPFAGHDVRRAQVEPSSLLILRRVPRAAPAAIKLISNHGKTPTDYRGMPAAFKAPDEPTPGARAGTERGQS